MRGTEAQGQGWYKITLGMQATDGRVGHAQEFGSILRVTEITAQSYQEGRDQIRFEQTAYSLLRGDWTMVLTRDMGTTHKINRGVYTGLGTIWGNDS